MNKKIKFATLVVSVFFAGLLTLQATDFKLDTKGTKKFTANKEVGPPELKFVSSAPLEEIIGYVKVDDIKSSLKLDPGNIEKTTGNVSFKITSLETGISMRNQHLQSETWLNAGKYPEIVFELKELKNVKITGIDKPAGRSSASATASGVFTMHGKSKAINVPVEIKYLKESSATKKRASGDLIFVDGSFTIALKDFNVVGKKGVVGKKVGETIDISFRIYYHGK